MSHEELITNFIDQERTEEVQAACSEWGEKSALHTVRTNLGITPETEKPYEIFVVENHIQDHVPGAGAYCVLTTPAQIVLPTFANEEEITTFIGDVGDDETEEILDYSDGERYLHLEHEYAHAESKGGLMVGIYGTLLRGANEAITEANVSTPDSYEDQRDVFTLVKHLMPDLPELSNTAYMGDENARRELFTKLFADGGSDVFLALARLRSLRPQSADNTANAVDSKVVLHPEKVKSMLFRKLGIDDKKTLYFPYAYRRNRKKSLDIVAFTDSAPL